MIQHLLILMVVMAIVVSAEWKQIRRANRPTQFLFFLLLGGSGAIWLYLSTSPQVIRPGSYLGMLLKHLDPFV